MPPNQSKQQMHTLPSGLSPVVGLSVVLRKEDMVIINQAPFYKHEPVQQNMLFFAWESQYFPFNDECQTRDLPDPPDLQKVVLIASWFLSQIKKFIKMTENRQS